MPVETQKQARGSGPGQGLKEPPARPCPGRRARIKDYTDRVLALAFLVLAAPVMLLAAALIKLTSRGPAFYSQTRLGLDGRPYTIYKIRTMTHDCEKQSGALWAAANDPRITPVGCFLRKTHLDELPQLWNVLVGDMSLVGPRPERPEFVPKLEEAIPDYRERLRVRPGVTGLAQVQLPADTDLDSVRRKLLYDLYYIRHMSWLLDAQILLSTAFKVFHVPFAASRALFRVPSVETVEPELGREAAVPRLASLQQELA